METYSLEDVTLFEAEASGNLRFCGLRKYELCHRVFCDNKLWTVSYFGVEIHIRDNKKN